MANSWLLYWNCSPKGAVRGSSATWAITSSAVSAWKLKMISGSRRGRPVQAQYASATVSRDVSWGSATAKAGNTSTSDVSQDSQPSSTRVAAMVLVIDLVTEPIIINVSGVTGS